MDDAIILPKTFPHHSVELGSLVRNPKRLNEHPFLPSSALTETFQINKPIPELNEKKFISLNKKGYFSAMLSTLIGSIIRGETAALLQVEGGEFVTRSFQDIWSAFKHVCDDKEAQQWFGDIAEVSNEAFFVTELQDLTGAKCTTVLYKSAGAEGWVTVPVDQLGTLNNVKFAAGVDLSKFAYSRGDVDGISGVKMQKVAIQRRKKGEQPKLKDSAEWVRAYETHRGALMEDMVVEVALEGLAGVEDLKDLRI